MPRHTRACNVVAFCPTDARMLAAGLDKVRNDFGLMVWDTEVATRSSVPHDIDTMYSDVGGGTGTKAAAAKQDVYPAGNMQESARFPYLHFPGSDLESTIDNRKMPLASGIDSLPRAAVNANPTGSPNKPLAQYGSSEGVSSAAWLHHSSPHLVAGMGLKWIRGFDLRNGTSNSNSMVISTKAVLGLAADPFNSHRFASFAEDNVVRLWDTRNSSEPALTFVADYRNGIGQLSWSTMRAGCLAVAGKDSPALKIWDIQEFTRRDANSTSISRSSVTKVNPLASTSNLQVPPNLTGDSILATTPTNEITDPLIGHVNGGAPIGIEGHSRVDSATAGVTGSNASGQVPYGSSDGPQSSAPLNTTELGSHTIPIIWKSRQLRPSTQSLQGFSWIPIPISDDFSQHVITVTTLKEQQFHVAKLPVTYQVALSPRGDLSVTGGRSVTIFSPNTRKGARNDSGLSDYLIDPRLSSAAPQAPSRQRSSVSIDRNLSVAQHDISVIMRKRAEAGYSMNAPQNLQILNEEDSDLKELWVWIINSRENANRARLRIGGVDYSGQGIQSVVQDMVTASSKLLTISNHGSILTMVMFPDMHPTTPLSAPTSPLSVDSAVPFTSYINSHRIAALVMCGWLFHSLTSGVNNSEGEESLEQILQCMEANDEYEKAAGWALFHSSSISRAVQALDASADERLKLVATALAGYSATINKSGSKLWHDMCRSLSADMKDPYLRAIFALIASEGDWRVVLQEQGLSIKDRIGVALRFLPDDELLAYINKITNKMVLLGDINGLPLTGLTPAGVDLMENYINRTGDVQTGVLLLCMVAPGRFTDARVEDWVETYRSLLDRWQLYRTRAQFDISRQRHLCGDGFVPHTPHPSTPYNSSPAPQIYVRCNFCNQPIANGLFASPIKKGPQASQAIAGSAGLHMTGGTPINPLMMGAGRQKVTSCPNCRKPLPRCALCLLHLGTPAENMQYFSRRDKPGTRLEGSGTTPSGFDLWFSWCQTCRHGGHAIHMLQWFDKHDICPVSDCSCRCREI
ncbi:hypothetical protein DFS34DRAFT_43429 [Phlyctochytrium arcticum]|nr:hypothetical protein DFS34DRAFT_43429 [Phlyctochytrium arcticum]